MMTGLVSFKGRYNPPRVCDLALRVGVKRERGAQMLTKVTAAGAAQEAPGRRRARSAIFHTFPR